jgi:hypothetical protein
MVDQSSQLAEVTAGLLNERELAPLLRVQIKTLQSWRQRGRGPRYLKVGSLVFYPTTEVTEFIRRHLVDPEANGAVNNSR